MIIGISGTIILIKLGQSEAQREEDIIHLPCEGPDKDRNETAAYISMVETIGNQFVVNNSPLYFNWFNTYWLMVLGVDQSTRGKVTEVFQQAVSIGLTVCRTRAF
ncbi:hypothetical protein Dimus_014861 [Dionaea muscipula]